MVLFDLLKSVRKQSFSGMNIWLLDPWDALPGELGFERGEQISRELVRRGHRVVWWTGTFSHAEKRQRPTQSSSLTGVTLRLLATRGYRRNVSVGRLLNIADFAIKYSFAQLKMSRPDAIIVSGPVFFAEPILMYQSIVHKIPLIFEFRDLWPESIINSAPVRWRWLYKAFFGPFSLGRKLVLRRSVGIVGLNKTYLDLAMREAGRGRSRFTAIAYPSPSMPPNDLANVSHDEQKSGEILVATGGTLGASYDHLTLLHAAALLKTSHLSFRFYITGSGPSRSEIDEVIERLALRNVQCVGSLPKREFQQLLCKCDLGVILYRNFSPVVFPTKLVDYLHAGIPVIISAQGEGADILESAGAGVAIAAESPEELVRALLTVSENPVRYAGMKRAAAELALEFRGEKQIEKIADVVEHSCGLP
jgi:glycosyltransferase involved in cell wall biosynthesis